MSSPSRALDLLANPRGLLMDALAFLVNLFAMSTLSAFMRGLLQRANADDPVASRALFGFGIALFLLAPIGATLARWGYQQRMANVEGERPNPLNGCLYSPIFFFCLTAVLFSAINAFVMQAVYGRREPEAAVFVGSIFGGLALMIMHTVLVYRYFAPYKRPPRLAFLRSRASQILGDGFLFANMAIYQSIWALLSQVHPPRPSGLGEIVGRLAILFFIALFLYFPPRMFYLAEDRGKRWVWVSILLANAPLLFRFLLGTG